MLAKAKFNKIYSLQDDESDWKDIFCELGFSALDSVRQRTNGEGEERRRGGGRGDVQN
jgi:hypothetical protein